MADTEKSGGISIVTPPRVVIAEGERRPRSRSLHHSGGRRSFSRSGIRHASDDEITPISNSATVPIEYRTL